MTSAGAFFTPARKAGLAVTALLYLAGAAAVYAFLDKDTLRTALALPASLFLALLALSVANYAVRAWRWVVFCAYLRLGVPLGKNVLYYLAGYSLTSTPGKAGETVRLWFLKSGHDVPYLRSLPLALADRIVDMWAVLLLTLVSIAGFADYAWQIAAVTVAIAAVSVPIVMPRRFERMLAICYGLAPRRGRLLVRARRIMRAMDALSSWRTYGLTLLPTVGGWLAEGTALYLLLAHLGAEISLLNAVFVFSFSMIVGAISMLPGGLGSTEVTMIVLLKALGVDLDTALVATAIIRITTFWFAVALGVAAVPAAMSAAVSAARAPREKNARPA